MWYPIQCILLIHKFEPVIPHQESAVRKSSSSRKTRNKREPTKTVRDSRVRDITNTGNEIFIGKCLYTMQSRKDAIDWCTEKRYSPCLRTLIWYLFLVWFIVLGKEWRSFSIWTQKCCLCWHSLIYYANQLVPDLARKREEDALLSQTFRTMSYCRSNAYRLYYILFLSDERIILP